ncbi:CBF/Mak21 family-domain-containing protein [Lipomyces arxii]|uniref:CBF/Mak21 family-domain-containing protein n=1 Tax=Lipomyces arxii TaxID=56418 RepID=UPI0034CDB7C7
MPASTGSVKKRTLSIKLTASKKSKNNVESSGQKGPEPTPEIILKLEQEIASSIEKHNNLVYLIQYMNNEDPQVAMLAATSLFRSFAKMLASNLLMKPKSSSAGSPQEIFTLWLRERYKSFKTKLVEMLNNAEGEVAMTALTILLRLVKADGSHLAPNKGEYYFPKILFKRVLNELLNQPESSLLLEFVDSYVNKYDDIRYYYLHFLGIIGNETDLSGDDRSRLTANILSGLYAVDSYPAQEEDLNEFWVELPKVTKQPVTKLAAQKAAFQDAWLGVLKAPLTTEQYKYVLQIMHKKIVPNIVKPLSLMDFITDSYDAGASVSLLALNALFVLMQKYNVNYPNFYDKLYALLDRNVMHVKYRSRFFRLLDLFLSSSHLPAQLVASFIKRLSRLAISSPPSAIVIIVPFIYNLLKRHVTCNVLLQRTNLADEELAKFGLNDPFDDQEPDPLKTGALDSSLWELATLQSHYHPNVATLAKIMSEPFTKPTYNIEDFMDHSYGTMLDAEFSKNIRNTPALEFELAKTVFESGDPNQPAYLAGWSLC